MKMYKCPKCGREMNIEVITTIPPKTRYVCFYCNYRSKVIDSQDDIDYTLPKELWEEEDGN